MKPLVTLLAQMQLLLLTISIIMGLQFSSNPFPEMPDTQLSVGVVFNGAKQDGGWNETFYNGFSRLKDKLNLRLIYKEDVDNLEENLRPVVKQMVETDHVEIVLAASVDYGPALLKIAADYPKVKFFYVGGWETSKNVATIFGRMYQQRYLSGVVAGRQTKTNHIGYVAAMPIPEVNRGIDAFTLGVRSVNPQAVVHVKWTGTWNNSLEEQSATGELLNAWPIDVLTEHQNTIAPLQLARLKGVQVIGYNINQREALPEVFLTAPQWDWAPLIEARLTECLEGRFKGQSYFTAEPGVVSLAPLSPLVKPGTGEIIRAVRRKMSAGIWDVFYGPIYDQHGVLRVPEGANISDKELIENLNWFVQGVQIEPD